MADRMADKIKISAGFARARERPSKLHTPQPVVETDHHLARVLNLMFPQAYVRLFHQPPHSTCSLFSLKLACKQDYEDEQVEGEAQEQLRPSLSELQLQQQARFEPSTEPSSRTQVIQFQEALTASLVEHQAKPVGLCPVRRAIYDQCFDELIRQVTVGCIEQGLLLFRIRNELRMTVNCYRRAYESAVRYGLNKALEAGLRSAQVERERQALEEEKSKLSREGRLHGATSRAADAEPAEESRSAQRELKLKEYYQGELAKRDSIIAQQRAIIRALNQRPQA